MPRLFSCADGRAPQNWVAAGKCAFHSMSNLRKIARRGGEIWAFVVTGRAATAAAPNVLVGLPYSVPRGHQGQGYARQVIKAMSNSGRSARADRPVALVRPSAKASFFLDVGRGRLLPRGVGVAAFALRSLGGSNVRRGASVIGTAAKRSMSVEEPDRPSGRDSRGAVRTGGAGSCSKRSRFRSNNSIWIERFGRYIETTRSGLSP